MTAINPRIFRAYDIRGKADIDLTKEACLLIGKAFGTVLREKYETEHPTVVVGRDARTHGPAFLEGVVEGLTQAGCYVLVMGQTPSPVNYFTICTRKLDGGIQVTASHNPKEDNGLKLQLRNAEAYSGEDLQDLRRRVEAMASASIPSPGTLPSPGTPGEGDEQIDAITPYLQHVARMFAEAGKGLRIVIDAGNGVAGPAYAKALRDADCDVTGLYLEPDGTFPNHPADPSKLSTLAELQARVRESKADVGLAFDGDGDRMGIVDEKGTIRTADEVLLLLAKDLLSRRPGSPVIFTVSNSGILETEVRKLGGKPVMCQVGHSFVEHAMREHHALIGGEQSGHFFCEEGYYGFDDALVASLRFLSILRAAGKPLSTLLDAFPRVYQAPEKRPHCPDDRKAEVIAAATRHFAARYSVNTLDGARIDFGDGAWAGIRQSNTSPCISVCIEARSPEKLKAVADEVWQHLRTYNDITSE